MIKIKKNDGITIVHAVVSVLIFAIFSSIILSATATNLKSARAQKNYQQAYLSVSNAADLFIKSIDGDYYEYQKVTMVKKDGTDGPSSPNGWTYVEGKDDFKNVTLANPLVTIDGLSSDNFFTLFTSAYLGVEQKHSYLINTTVSGNGANFSSAVACDVTMLAGGDLIAEFYLANPIGNDNYYMYVELPVIYVDINNDSPFSSEEVDLPSGSTYASKRTDTYRIEYDVPNMIVSKGRYAHE